MRLDKNKIMLAAARKGMTLSQLAKVTGIVLTAKRLSSRTQTKTLFKLSRALDISAESIVIND